MCIICPIAIGICRKMVGTQKSTHIYHVSMPVRFLFGGTSAMLATSVVHPMDVLKTRMQVSGEGTRVREYKTSLHAMAGVYRKEGIWACYSGLSAGLLRQATYATTRLGIYTVLFEYFTKRTPDGKTVPPNLSQKTSFAIAAGAIGALVGTPAEVCLIRMSADGRLPIEQRRNYQSVFHALYRISREEGGEGLFRGVRPTVFRAMVTNIAQLASYSQAKEFILSTGVVGDNVITHFFAGMLSGFLTAFASMPVDMAKTRVQNMRYIGGTPEYNGMFDVMTRVIKREGFVSLWKGFTPYYMRIGPHTVLTLIFLEELNHMYGKFVLGKDHIGGL